MENNKNIKAGIWYTLSNFLVKGASFLATPVILRLVSQESYGNYVNFNSWLSILMIVATGYMANSILCAQFDFKEKVNAYIKTITLLSSGIALAFFFLFCIFHNWAESVIGVKFHYIILMFLYLAVDAAYQNMLVSDRLNLVYKRVVVLSAALVILPLIGSIAGAYFFEDELWGLLYGKMIPMILICIGLYVWIIIKNKGGIQKEYCRYALKISLPYVPHALSSMLLITSDRIIIQQLCGPNKVALYNVVYTCSMIISLVYNAMSQAWSPWLVKKLEEQSYQEIRENSKPYYLVFIAFATGAMLISPELLWIIGGKEYLSVLNLMPPIMMGIVIQYFYSYFVNVEFFYKKTSWISMNTMIATAINIALNYLLIPVWGFGAAAYTTLIGYAFLLLFHYVGVRRLNMSHIYDNKWHLTILGAYGVLTILCNQFLYEQLLVRYILVLAIGIWFLRFIWKQGYLKSFIK